METAANQRCLVVDRHPLVRLGVRNLLEIRYEVEEADDAGDALQLLTDLADFDVAIVELGPSRSAKLDGTGAIRALRDASPGLGIVAQGLRADRHAATEAIRSGASAYVAKSSAADALLDAVDAAAQAETFVDPAADDGNGRRSAVTRRQREILQSLAEGNSTAGTAKRLGLSVETVRTHTKATLQRLGAHHRAHAVAIGLRSGLIE